MINESLSRIWSRFVNIPIKLKLPFTKCDTTPMMHAMKISEEHVTTTICKIHLHSWTQKSNLKHVAISSSDTRKQHLSI